MPLCSRVTMSAIVIEMAELRQIKNADGKVHEVSAKQLT